MLTIVPIAVGGAIALCSALCTVWLTNKSSTAREKLKLDHDAAQRRAEVLRDRGEEFYETVEKWLMGLTTHYMDRAKVMRGKLTFNQCLELEIASGEKYPIDVNRVELLIDAYFPSTRAAYDEVSKGRDKLNDIAGEHKKAYARGDLDGSRFLEPLSNVMKSVYADGEVLKSQIVTCIRLAVSHT